MHSPESYWQKRTSRRTALRSALAAGGGLAALSLVGCGDDDEPSGGGTSTGGSTGSTATGTGSAASGDPVSGGRLIIQPTGYATTLVLVTSRNNSTAGLAGFTHSGLLQLKNSRPIVGGSDVSVEPDLAMAMPEQPDPLTYIFKLHPAKFHNGRDVTFGGRAVVSPAICQGR